MVVLPSSLWMSGQIFSFGLGGCVLADYVTDSVWTLLAGAATPKAGACHLAHILLG